MAYFPNRDQLERRWSLTRIMQHRLFRDPGLSYVMAVAYALVGWSYFADPAIAQRTVVGGAVAPYDATWNGLYLLGAALILTRLVFGRSHWESAGLVCLVGGWALNGAVALAVQGMLDIRSYVFFVFVGGSMLRLRILTRG